MTFAFLGSVSLLAWQAVSNPAPAPPPPVVIINPPPKADTTTMEKRARATNACRRAAMGQDYFPQPAIWKIRRGNSTMYLVGTVHRLPAGFDWRSEELDRVIHESQSLITETGMRPSLDFVSGNMKLMTELGATSTLAPIADRVSGERRAKWLGMSSMMSDYSVQRINGLPSWLAGLAIAVASEVGKPPTYTAGVDDLITSEFTKAGKPVAAIEDRQTVVALMSSIPAEAQQQVLDGALDAVGTPDVVAKRFAPYHRWAKGEVDASADISSQLPKDIRDRLLDRRNEAWVGVLKRRLSKPGVTLVAVGAAHLRGENSLIDLLARQDIKAERLTPGGAPRPRSKFLPTPASWTDCSQYMFGAKKPIAGVD